MGKPQKKATTLRATVETDLREGGILSQALPGYEERTAQIEMAQGVADALENGEHFVVEASTGTGKALDVDTPIPTPNGWKRMGDIVIGDLVFDDTGTPTRVIAAFDVMTDRICYEVKFSDGSSIVADAEHEWVSFTAADRKHIGSDVVRVSKNFITAEKLHELEVLISQSSDENLVSMSQAVHLIGGHLWSVRQAACTVTPNHFNGTSYLYPCRTLLYAVSNRLARDLVGQRRDGRVNTVITTEKMAQTLTIGDKGAKRANHAIAVASPLTLPDVELPIDPYFLGVWLGDGSSRSNQITTADPELIPEIERAGYTVRSLASHPYLYVVDDENGKAMSRWQPGMTGRLRALGLILNKHIPTKYLRASEQQRWALLAGLLDTDGTVSHVGAVEFTTTLPQLAQGVHELACSLGLRPSIRKGIARLNGIDCGPKWTLAFTTNQPVFRLKRKMIAQEQRLLNFTPERNRFRYVVSVNQVPSRPVRCIQVEASSHLYLAGNAMIPTHNSIAYIIPIVRSSKVALISTANKALQEQLFYKDIPFVQQHVQPFQAALVKGMGNYLCLDRLDEELPFQQLAGNEAFAEMMPLLDEDSTWDGDFDLLPMALPGDVRGRIAADSDQCAWRACPHFGDCYVKKMRDRSQEAQVIVINHTLLLLDASMDGWLLPERDLIVIDEAHHLEEEATRAFTITVTPSRVASLLAQHRLREHVSPQVLQDVQEADIRAWNALERFIHLDAKGRQMFLNPLEEGLRLASALDTLASSLQLGRPENLDSKEDQLFDKLVKRTRNLAADTRVVFSYKQPDERVYYVERLAGAGRRAPQLAVSAGPLDVTKLLREKLFDKISTIATSATLAINKDFRFFRSRVGLDAAHEVVLPLTFNYREHALLYTPRMRLEPAYGSANGPYLEELAGEMRQLVEASDGRAFLLFSSRNALDTVYGHLQQLLEDDGYGLLVQGGRLGRSEMVRQFREMPRAVLFGLKSFWEGVDVAGEALSLVVIDKLPFDPPDDPVQEARVTRMKEAGQNWFGDYVLPQAILRLKQGIGRLLRTQDDRGVMAILDKRLYTKGYGNQVIAALPPARRTASIADVQSFFEQIAQD